MYFFLGMLGGKVLCETEILDPMPHSIFLLEPRIRSPYELGLLCLSLLCWGASNHCGGLTCCNRHKNTIAICTEKSVSIVGLLRMAGCELKEYKIGSEGESENICTHFVCVCGV